MNDIFPGNLNSKQCMDRRRRLSEEIGNVLVVSSDAMQHIYCTVRFNATARSRRY